MEFDYIVIGAGPAGCICAGELKKRNFSVCVLEQNEKDYRKVCGDGISFECIKILRSIGFPVEYFEQAAAVKIKKYIHYLDEKKYVDYISEHDKEAYGIPRNRTDGVFRKYLEEDLGIAVHYGQTASDIKKNQEGLYEICGYKAKNVIIATGAMGRVNLDSRSMIAPSADYPVGVSAIIRAKYDEEPYFMFDYNEKYKGTYSWIFSIGKDEYNVGLWLKEDKDLLNSYFEEFLEGKVREYLGDNFEVIRKPKGALMAIGKRRPDYNQNIFFVGDAANTSNPKDGEGISLAVKDALTFIDRMDK